MPNTIARILQAAALAASLAVTPALAQNYPTSPVHLIVAYSAGGTGDVVARVVAPKLSQALGQSVIVENRAGARHRRPQRRHRCARRLHAADRPDRRSRHQPALAQRSEL
jgi:hypothetical protein